MDGKNLILGWLYDRSMNELMAFYKSAIQASVGMNVVTLAWFDGGGFTWKGIRDLGFELIEVPHVELDKLTHFISRRYQWYQWYLEQHKFERVVLTGLRDVVIQSDPFKYNDDGKLCLFLESRKISECNWNKMWLEQNFGRQELEKIWDNPVSCAEIVLGPYDLVLDYVRKMNHYISGPGIRAGVIDQAVHNYLLWNNQLSDVRTFQPATGPVFNMGYAYSLSNEHPECDPKFIKLNKLEQVLNNDGSVPTIVHQYDRFKFLEDKIRAKYR